MISEAQKGRLYAQLGEHLLKYIDRMNDIDEVDTAERILDAFLPGANKILNEAFSEKKTGDIVDEWNGVEGRTDFQLDTVVFIAKDMYATKHPKLVVYLVDDEEGRMATFTPTELRELADHLDGL